ncbi:hypothetical protein PG988_012055 [Apiospora saccharicola]
MAHGDALGTRITGRILSAYAQRARSFDAILAWRHWDDYRSGDLPFWHEQELDLGRAELLADGKKESSAPRWLLWIQDNFRRKGVDPHKQTQGAGQGLDCACTEKLGSFRRRFAPPPAPSVDDTVNTDGIGKSWIHPIINTHRATARLATSDPLIWATAWHLPD